MKRCPYCQYTATQHLVRHMLNRHKEVVRTKTRAQAIAKTLVVGRHKGSGKRPRSFISEQEIAETHPDYFDNPATEHSVKMLCEKLDVRIVPTIQPHYLNKEDAEASVEAPSESSEEEGEEDEGGTKESVKALRNRYGLHRHLNKDCFLTNALRVFLTRVKLRDERSSVLSCKRVSQMLGFIVQKAPDALIWELIVDTDLMWDFIELGERKCNTQKATSLLFIKDNVLLLEAILKDWWPKKAFPSMPDSPDFHNKLTLAETFWNTKIKLYGHQSKQEVNKKLTAKQNTAAADLNATYDYLEDPE